MLQCGARLATVTLEGMAMRLTGKVALITGGARGIGRQVALTFAREGARVMIGDVLDGGGETTVREVVAAGGEAACQVCDVTSFEAVGALVEAAVTTFGRLDVLVNNAYMNRSGTVVDISLEDWSVSRSAMLDATFYERAMSVVFWLNRATLK